MNWVNRIIDKIIYTYIIYKCVSKNHDRIRELRRVEKSINYAIKMSLQLTKSFFWAKQITRSIERKKGIFFFYKKSLGFLPAIEVFKKMKTVNDAWLSLWNLCCMYLKSTYPKFYPETGIYMFHGCNHEDVSKIIASYRKSFFHVKRGNHCLYLTRMPSWLQPV